MEIIIQWATVGIILIIVVLYIIKKIRRKGRGACSCCELNDLCAAGKINEKPGKCNDKFGKRDATTPAEAKKHKER